MTDTDMEEKKAFMEIHYRRFEEWNRDGNVPGYCAYFCDDIHFTIESTTSDNVHATGIKAVTDLLNGVRDASNGDPFDGFRHETKSARFININPCSAAAEIFFHIWQRIKTTGEWKQQMFNRMRDEGPKPGRFSTFITAKNCNGKWLVTESRANTDGKQKKLNCIAFKLLYKIYQKRVEQF